MKNSKSITDLNRSLEMEQNNLNALMGRGLLQLISRYEESLADFNIVLEIKQNNVEAYMKNLPQT